MSDIGGLFAYLFGNPYLFISSTTVMTSGLVMAAVAMNALPARAGVLSRVAPALALILAYFGGGSMALATEILLRWHHLIPYETEVQFVSGLGHFAVALIGIAALLPYLRARRRVEWLWAQNVALAYWAFQIVVLTPPWFSFADQRALVTTAGLLMLALAAAINAAQWVQTPRSVD